MLVLHQTGTVKVGEVVRYTLTYTPSQDPILPSPPALYLKIKNTSAIALRAAFVHGPYALYVSACPGEYRTDKKWENPKRDGVPEFEPNLKAGASWCCTLQVPETVRQGAGSGNDTFDGILGKVSNDEQEGKSVSWIIEVASQVIFSTSAAVHYEVLVGRDEKSLSLGLGSGMGMSSLSVKANAPTPGQVRDFTGKPKPADGSHQRNHMKGVYSRAIKLKVQDTAALWNCPKLPEWEDEGLKRPTTRERIPLIRRSTDARGSFEAERKSAEEMREEWKKRKQKKVHLVVVTHGLHSNLGADMLFLKESIDEATRKAKENSRKRRAERREKEKQEADAAGQTIEEYRKSQRTDAQGKTKLPAEQKEEDQDESEDEEEVIVRGFSGNAVRTEKGIKYLGKRLAKYVLAMTYPDQPFRSVSRSTGDQAHSSSSIRSEPVTEEDRKLAYRITSISFIAHSLGGLTQTYAVAYIQKHSPDFFDKIRGVNFIALATPFLGLSNENPLYVKFALDFGLVGRTGQDLGLTWRAPNIARSSWGALVGGIGESAKQKAERPRDPGAKPLLRILPTGPAHVALKKFRNRTVYSNVVNDGIVPLRTSCLLFLDWQGLGRVEKARRENGLVGTMAGWGWAELTGQNSSEAARKKWLAEVDGQDDEASEVMSTSPMEETEEGDGGNTPTRQGRGDVVPQPSSDVMHDDVVSLRSLKMAEQAQHRDQSLPSTPGTEAPASTTKGPLDTLMDFFTPKPSKPPQPSRRQKIYERSQTMKSESQLSIASGSTESKGKASSPPSDVQQASAPPVTSFFEAAGDLLAPPLPPLRFLIDPSKRPRTVFHDRVYHPEDIPAPPKRRPSGMLLRRRTGTDVSNASSTSKQSSASSASMDSNASVDTLKGSTGSGPAGNDSSGLKVEEKIARAYHRDLSWRKVLVRLEPDAHNNIIVRRKFANAYGWPVVKHLVDTHFSDAAVSRTRDEAESGAERAKDANQEPTASGREVKDDERDKEEEPAAHQFLNPAHRRSTSGVDGRTPCGSVSMETSPVSSPKKARMAQKPTIRNMDSAQWSEADFQDSADESDFDHRAGSPELFMKQRDDKEKQKERDARKEEEQKSMGTSAGGWNWTEAIVGKGAVHGPKRVGSGGGGPVERVKDGHVRRDSREFTLQSPREEEDEDGDITPTVSKSAVPDEALLSPGDLDASVGLGHGPGAPLSPIVSEEEGVVERVARLSLGHVDVTTPTTPTQKSQNGL